MERAMFDRVAPRLGITNGQVSRQQFMQIAEQMRSRGGMPGGGGPGGAGFGGGNMPAEQMDRFADERFRRTDQNGDGLLQITEMSERLRPVWEKFDTNRDGAMDLTEYKSYMRNVFQPEQPSTVNIQGPGQGQPPPTVPPMDINSGSTIPDDAQKPTVYRAGKLPKDIPQWFEQLDTDKDGQVGLYEWVRGSRALDEFRGMDRNEDGFLVIDEIMVVVRGNSTNRPGGSAGEMVAAGNNLGGNNFNAFSGGGNGNPFAFRFGDNSQLDNRGRPRGPGGMRGEGGRGPGGNANGNGNRGEFNRGPGGGFGGWGGFIPNFGGGNGGGGGPGFRGRGPDNGGGRNDNFGGNPGGPPGRGRDGGFNRQDNGPNSPPVGPNGNGNGPRRNRDRGDSPDR
jgi:Ca2+-binding EF-hand superfamily protein